MRLYTVLLFTLNIGHVVSFSPTILATINATCNLD
ncbi:hypothetical protein EhV145_00310 [Emiliania huxleyi virus 145]|nr:hypothetical protein EhV145_00310 [Emiliania huxleyi virus 145]AHA55880.1 hypothetical protein EhV164_00293 [Emiliania huxleyi virus 164]